MNTIIKEEIINYSLENKSEEVCGFICYDVLGNIKVIKCNNIAINKKNSFEIDPNIYLITKSQYNIFAFFHSHVSDSVNFSKRDKDLSDSFEIPIYLYNIKYNIWKEYLPINLSFELLEQSFCWGLFDCYSMVRYFFWKRLGIYLNDYDRSENFDGSIINKETIIKEGFVQIDNINEIKDNDIIWSLNQKQLYAHLAVYSKGYIFEHRRKRLSEQRIFIPAPSKMKILRYKDF